MDDRQEWATDKDKYKEQFPTLGGKSRKQKKQDMLKAKEFADFPMFEHGATKKPVKYSDSMKQIMKNERFREMEKYGMKPVAPSRKAPAPSSMSTSASDYKFDEYAGNLLKVGNLEEKVTTKKKKKKAGGVVEEGKWFEPIPEVEPPQPKVEAKKESKKESKKEAKKDPFALPPEQPAQSEVFAEARGGGGKKRKKPKASVVCAPTEFYEVSDKIEIDFDEPNPGKKEKKKKGKEKTDFQKMFYEEKKDDDLADFNFPDGSKLAGAPVQNDTFVDDSMTIMRGAGKKKRGGFGHRQKWVELNPHELKNVDYGKLYH